MSKIQSTLDRILNETDLTEPGDVADALLEQLSAEDREDALHAALIYWTRSKMSRMRKGVPSELIGRPVGGRNLEIVEPASQTARSAKVAGIRDWWTTFISNRVNVDGEWKLMGDCTIPDVMTLARERRDLAARNAARADQFEALAHEMRTAGAMTVRSLDRERVKRSLAA